jgi:hypothetical protein
MKNSTKVKILTGALGVATLFSCDNGTTTSNPCSCPVKIHGNEPCKCGGDECSCEQKTWNTNLYNVTVDNQTGVKLPVDLITNIKNAMNAMNAIDAGLMSNVSSRNATVNIINGSSSNVLDGNTIEIGIERLDEYIDVYAELGSLFPDMILQPDSNAGAMLQFDSNTIRLANGKNMNMGQIIASGRQFNNAKQIVRNAFRRSQQRQA